MNGLMGECPDWYPLYVASEQCNCPPWELLKQSVYWRDKALIKSTAEYQAAKIRQDAGL